MQFNMERWYSAVNQRFSMRKYSASPDEEEIKTLEEAAALLSTADVRLVVTQSDKVFAPNFLGMGKIKGTQCFAGILAKKGEPSMVGYLGEAFALECTAMGLGTCWLGQSFNKGAASASTNKNADEKLAAAISIGKPEESYTMRPRKTLSKLTGLTQTELIELPEWQQRAFECARMAPSAVNAQPWRFTADGDTIMLECVNNNFGFGEVDCGIAMLHIELGAAHAGVIGSWKTTDEYWRFTPEEFNN